MDRYARWFPVAALMLAFSSPAQAGAGGFSSQTINRYSERTPVFTENRGQWDEQVLFKAEGAGGLTWWLERDGFTVVYSQQMDSQQIKRIKQMETDPFSILSASSASSAQSAVNTF